MGILIVTLLILLVLGVVLFIRMRREQWIEYVGDHVAERWLCRNSVLTLLMLMFTGYLLHNPSGVGTTTAIAVYAIYVGLVVVRWFVWQIIRF